MDQIALVGAAGVVGRSIGVALQHRGQEFRAIGRDRRSLESAFRDSKEARLAVWNPSDPASAGAALRGIDTLFYLIGVPYHQFHLHPIVMKQALDAAIAEGVQRFLLVGPVYSYGVPRSRPVTEEHPREPETYKGKMRRAQEDLLFEAHAAGKILGANLRLPDFYGPHVATSYLDSLFRAAAHGGTANMLGPIDTPHEFVFVPDVGPVALALAEREEAYGRLWNLGGYGVMKQREIVDQVFRMAGRKPSYRVAGKLTLRVLGLFNPIMRELVEMSYLLTNPVILDDTALHRLLGSIHKTPYDEGFRLSLL